MLKELSIYKFINYASNFQSFLASREVQDTIPQTHPGQSALLKTVTKNNTFAIEGTYLTFKLPYYVFIYKLSTSDHNLKIKLLKVHTLQGRVKERTRE